MTRSGRRCPLPSQWWAFLLAPLWLLALSPAGARADDGLTAERQRRNTALVQEGFNLTQSVSLPPPPATTRIELSMLPSGEEHVVALWFATTGGELRIRFTGPTGEVLASWTGKSGEQRLMRRLAAGTYVVEATGAAGRGLVGVKGPVVHHCAVDKSRLNQHAADAARGFHWPYLLMKAARPKPTRLLVLPNNSGFVSEDIEVLGASAVCQLSENLALADHLGAAILVPIFPRPAVAGPEENLYLHALTRAALTARAPKLARVDRQLIAMIDDARRELGADVSPRILLAGFSAAASFSNRFAVLHPDRVQAVAVGSPGGWPIAPSSDNGLTFPVGLADAPALTGETIDQAALRRVRFFFFLGTEDTNDAVPYRDSFSAADEALIMRRFGKTPVARWDAARRLYEQAGLDATFKIYPGVGHTVSAAMAADVEAALGSGAPRP